MYNPVTICPMVAVAAEASMTEEELLPHPQETMTTRDSQLRGLHPFASAVDALPDLPVLLLYDKGQNISRGQVNRGGEVWTLCKHRLRD